MRKFLLSINWKNTLGALTLTVIGYLLTEGVPKFWVMAWSEFRHNGYEDYRVLASDILNVPVPFWKVLLGFFVATSLVILFTRIKRRNARMNDTATIEESRQKRSPIWDEEIGNYTVDELYRILSAERLPIRTTAMDIQGIPTPNNTLIELLGKYHIPLSSGRITNRIHDAYDDAGYGFSILAPKLMMYGIVEKEQETIEPEGYDSFIITTYRISENGFKFLACLEKLAYQLGKK